MRPLLVKSQTAPESGCFDFFRRVNAGAVVSRSGVLTLFLYAGANPRGDPKHVARFHHY